MRGLVHIVPALRNLVSICQARIDEDPYQPGKRNALKVFVSSMINDGAQLLSHLTNNGSSSILMTKSAGVQVMYSFQKGQVTQEISCHCP